MRTHTLGRKLWSNLITRKYPFVTLVPDCAPGTHHRHQHLVGAFVERPAHGVGKQLGVLGAAVAGLIARHWGCTSNQHDCQCDGQDQQSLLHFVGCCVQCLVVGTRLGSVGPVDLGFMCSIHGLVWHKTYNGLGCWLHQNRAFWTFALKKHWQLCSAICSNFRPKS